MRILPHKWSDWMLDKKIVRVTLTDFYLGVVCIFPVATMLVDEGIVNKFLFTLLLGLQVAMLFDRPLKKKTFVLLLLLIVNFVYTLSNTEFPMENSNLLVYYPFYMVYTYFMCDNWETVLFWFKKNRRFVFSILMIWTVLVGFSILLPGSYYVKEGGNTYFGSFVASIFRLGQAAMFIQALAIIMQTIYGYKKAFFFNLVPMYCYFMGSSRTYLVLGLCLMAVSWYLYCSKPRLFWSTIIPSAAVVLVLLGMTSMGEKIAYTLDDERYGDFWFRITSSRSLLWEVDMLEWGVSPMLSKLLGCGIEFTILASGRWAHNDFIEIICSFGIVGVVHYVYSIGHLFASGRKRAKMPFIVSVCLFMAWFFNAFFNMHYVYICAMLCYPFLYLSVKEYFAERNANAAMLKEPEISK